MIDPLNPNPQKGKEREWWEAFLKTRAYRQLLESEMRCWDAFYKKEKERHEGIERLRLASAHRRHEAR